MKKRCGNCKFFEQSFENMANNPEPWGYCNAPVPMANGDNFAEETKARTKAKSCPTYKKDKQ